MAKRVQRYPSSTSKYIARKLVPTFLGCCCLFFCSLVGILNNFKRNAFQNHGITRQKENFIISLMSATWKAKLFRFVTNFSIFHKKNVVNWIYKSSTSRPTFWLQLSNRRKHFLYDNFLLTIPCYDVVNTRDGKFHCNLLPHNT